MKSKSCALILFLVFGMSLYGADSVFSSTYIPGQWGFSSDHLPIAATIRMGKYDLHVASFNVLNENYKNYIVQGQQLGGSDLHRMPMDERDNLNLAIIIDQPIDIFAVQECSQGFLNLLMANSNDNFGLAFVSNGPKDFGAVRFNKSVVEMIGHRIERYGLDKSEKKKYMQILSFRHKLTGTLFTFINTHADFGKVSQLRALLNSLPLTDLILATGDMNVGYHDPKSQSDLQSQLKDGLQNYEILRPEGLFTHVNTVPALDAFDHFVFRNMKVFFNEELTRLLRKDFSLTNELKSTN